MTNLRKLIPAAARQRVREFRTERKKKALFGDLASFVPAPEAMYDGPESYEAFKNNGEEFLKICVELCALRRDEKMLDVGSGMGRKALALTQYFGPGATYDGIELVKSGVEWCSNGIGKRYPRFRFQQIDVYNKHYNPGGRSQAADYRFPFPDDTFTFVLLGSVFTHMLPADLANYLKEIGRVMAPGGRCLITYFLLDDDALRQVEQGKDAQGFKHVGPGYRTTSLEVPEEAIAFDEKWIRGLYETSGLKITRVEHGSWTGLSGRKSYQDIVIATKA
jgi:SAM-dependent methyltransferase